jgi:hypothetical protein
LTWCHVLGSAEQPRGRRGLHRGAGGGESGGGLRGLKHPMASVYVNDHSFLHVYKAYLSWRHHMKLRSAKLPRHTTRVTQRRCVRLCPPRLNLTRRRGAAFGWTPWACTWRDTLTAASWRRRWPASAPTSSKASAGVCARARVCMPRVCRHGCLLSCGDLRLPHEPACWRAARCVRACVSSREVAWHVIGVSRQGLWASPRAGPRLLARACMSARSVVSSWGQSLSE